MIVRVPAFAVNRTKRLIKTPKLYWGDVGLGLHVAGDVAPSGAHLENIVLHDLLVWRETRTCSLCRGGRCYKLATHQPRRHPFDTGTASC